MYEGAIFPDRVESVRVETVHETPEAQRRLRTEVAVLERLRGAEGVPQLVDAPRYPESLTLDELRELSRGIHPAVLARGGLGPALNALARRSQLPVGLTVHLPDRLPERVEVSAYYTVGEALTNAAKHSHAQTITVSVDHDAARGELRIEVSDDGVGGADFACGTGLLGLKDRAEALGRAGRAAEFERGRHHGTGTVSCPTLRSDS